jgi:hypothetical protein
MNSIEQKNLKLPFGAALASLRLSLDFDSKSLDFDSKRSYPLFTASVAVCMSGSDYTGCNSSQIHYWVLSFCKEATTSSQENPKAGAGAGAGELG